MEATEKEIQLARQVVIYLELSLKLGITRTGICSALVALIQDGFEESLPVLYYTYVGTPYGFGHCSPMPRQDGFYWWEDSVEGAKERINAIKKVYGL